MDKQKQRIKIAEVCGWKNIRITEIVLPDDEYLAPVGKHAHIECINGSYAPDGTEIPDYPNDLNAMHEAEKYIMDENSIIYLEWLERLSCPWHATAAQRAEAFLKTLGLWED